MAIRGDLLSVDLSNVFQMLALNRKRGILEITNRENFLEKRSFVLDEDKVALHNYADDRELDGALVDIGVLDYEAFTNNRFQARRFQISATDSLLKRRNIDYTQYEQARRHLQEESILEIFLWRNVSFSLDEEAPLPAKDDDRVFFVVDQIVMEAARRQDEWQRILTLLGGTAHEIFSPTRADTPPEVEAMDTVTRLVYDYIDGVRGTQEIMRATGFERYQVTVSLSKLVEAGFAKVMSLDALLLKGDQLVGSGRVGDAIRLFKSAVRHDRKSVSIHRRLANANLSEHRVAKAAAHLKLCALTLHQRGQSVDAFAIWQEILRILPTDFRAIEKALALRREIDTPVSEDDRELIDLGGRLFNLWFDLKCYDRAARVQELIIALQPNDPAQEISLARVYGKLGRIKEAVEVYMRVAGRLKTAGDLDGAMNVYKAVLSYNGPGKLVCHQRINEIHEILDRRRRHKVAGIAAMCVAGAIFLAVFGYGLYHRGAEKRFDELRIPEEGRESEVAWRNLKHAADALRRDFPFTKAATRARAIGDLATLKSDFFRRNVENDKLKKAELAQMTRLESRDLHELAMQRREAMDLEGALDLAEQAIQKLESAGQGHLVAKEGLDRFRDSLRRHINSQTDLEERAGAALAEGRREEAFNLLRALVATDDRDRLSAGDIRIVSRSMIERIRIPLGLRALPADAVIHVDGGEGAAGPLDLDLSHARPRAEVVVKRAGYADETIVLDWTTSPHRTLVVMRPTPAARHEFKERLAGVFAAGEDLMLVSQSGRVRRWSPVSVSVIVEWRAPVLLNVVEAHFVTADRIVLRNSDGTIYCVNGLMGVEVWNHSARPGELVIDGGRLACADQNHAGRVRVIDVVTGRTLWTQDKNLEGVVPLAAAGGRVLLRAPDGRALLLDARTGAASGASMADLSGVFSAGSMLFCLAGGRLLTIGDGGFDSVPEAGSDFEAAGVVRMTGGGAIVRGGAGNWVLVRPSGAVQLMSGQGDQARVDDGAHAAWIDGSDHFLMTSGDRHLAVNAGDGVPFAAFGMTSRIAGAAWHRNRCWIAYAGHGVLETFVAP